MKEIMDEILSGLGILFIIIVIFLIGFHKGSNEYKDKKKEKTKLEKFEERLEIIEGKLFS